jgi:thiol-disulfide isomerase/thioredoxin
MNQLLLILILVLLFLIILNTFQCNEDFITQEDINEKKPLYIFLMNNCEFCKEFENNKYDKLVNELGNLYNIRKVYLENNRDLFIKYNVERVPTVVLELNNKIEKTEEINKEIILKAHKLLSDDKKELKIFLSKNCPHCINYLNKVHEKLKMLLNKEFNFRLIFIDEDIDNLFTKYKVQYVPKAIVSNGNIDSEVIGTINYENIMKACNKKNNMLKENFIINNLSPDEITNYDNEPDEINNQNEDDYFIDEDDDIESLRLHKAKQEIYEKLENKINKENENKTSKENIYKKKEENNNKNKIIIFLSKTCPGCINYIKNIESKVIKEFSNQYIIENKFIDEEPNLFSKYDIEYVPQVMIIHENKNEKIEDLSIENIKNTIEKLNKEGFSNIDNKNVELLVFLTKTCPHCVKYDNDIHYKLEKQLEKKCRIRKIYADNDKENLFDKYNIEYVPKGLLLSKERYVPIEGALDNETISKYLEKINN